MNPNWRVPSAILCTAFVSLLSTATLADCGDVPAEPEILDGATATMDQLVANSKSVNAYIAEMDTYLDCREAGMQTEEFAALSKTVRKATKKEVKNLTERRNEIGPRFNAEVQAYKKHHPE